MFLKSLDIYGFKSFADKTHIDFAGGITSLLGPNGCGKSNIVDSIKWVLGEKSTKSLRAGKMEDVIFGGTQKRSAVGFAEATLTLDNSDRALAYEADEETVEGADEAERGQYYQGRVYGTVYRAVFCIYAAA